ncbi:hypothetical protein AWC16_06930 [Mycolicibacter longobardus]|uniref:Uncharacterized protein n=1 Tax=Mycolicibacter longobardus TaxID=1108812 RepID=A0A1X1YPB2_9MYCO|nr:hypothetical protein AWC16_06930 [Mycolicibacter longobardus]
MTLYRETSTGTIWRDQELLASLASEIEALDDDTLLKREYRMYGDAAIREYVIECGLVGIYDDLDGDDLLYRRTVDGQEFAIAELERLYVEEMSGGDPRRRQILHEWFSDMVGRGLLVEVAEGGGDGVE